MLEIKLAGINNLDTIVELINKVTLHLHENGIKQWTYPCNRSEIEMDIKKRHSYVLLMDDFIVGTFSLKDIKDFDFFLMEPNSKYLYKIAILPEYQGKKLGMEIVNYACGYSRNLKSALYLDCFAGNKKLRNFYSDAGFDFTGDFPEENYMVSVFKYKD
ncbi:GNAT family N-acetyltransferase [Clostridium tagluense]|uniref:GNAT family N-acetyltransferase n=1 Tax=Clostridium tagluense TaxID=360422 RepID=UPI001CF35F0E|nr:GNAT family N-acetyltransferase [Clostridium tagluense]MCB2296196.1 GNAT family N-acetyltransferase [Clostridium tagluense]